jgi:hypothetical protein
MWYETVARASLWGEVRYFCYVRKADMAIAKLNLYYDRIPSKGALEITLSERVLNTLALEDRISTAGLKKRRVKKEGIFEEEF